MSQSADPTTWLDAELQLVDVTFYLDRGEQPVYMLAIDELRGEVWRVPDDPLRLTRPPLKITTTQTGKAVRVPMFRYLTRPPADILPNAASAAMMLLGVQLGATASIACSEGLRRSAHRLVIVTSETVYVPTEADLQIDKHAQGVFYMGIAVGFPPG